MLGEGAGSTGGATVAEAEGMGAALAADVAVGCGVGGERSARATGRRGVAAGVGTTIAGLGRADGTAMGAVRAGAATGWSVSTGPAAVGVGEGAEGGRR